MGSSRRDIKPANIFELAEEGGCVATCPALPGSSPKKLSALWEEFIKLL
ncbi:MAG TPA: hypothetical protein VMU80_24120 [Bryobacteraceae bacterium]|nr:hypothetical protein [Bryobacteraceae bacterium]